MSTVTKLKKIKAKYPFVSICTPTFNRRPFITAAIECFKNQDYPKSKMEWIILDDGTDKIEDLVKDIPQVRYYKYDEQMVLGKKRNKLNSLAKGDIIVYMDDDDYQCPMRVSHSVQMLKTHPRAYCAGSSIINIYYKHINKMYEFGPYGPFHATAGTFAFRKELLKITSFDDSRALAEEKHFLKNYTIPMVQLEPKKTILVISHKHNTFDKKELLNNINNKVVRETDKTPADFIKDENLLTFYIDYMDHLLDNYEQGGPNMKPEVIRQRKEIEDKRKANTPAIILSDDNGNEKSFSSDDIAKMLNSQTIRIQNLLTKVEEKEQEITRLRVILKENNITGIENNTDTVENTETAETAEVELDNNTDIDSNTEVDNNTVSTLKETTINTNT